jgi:hypothetical protein
MVLYEAGANGARKRRRSRMRRKRRTKARDQGLVQTFPPNFAWRSSFEGRCWERQETCSESHSWRLFLR